MRTIYSEASSVLIWLGEGDEHSDTLFEVISKDGIPSPPDRNDGSDSNPLQKEFTIEIYRSYAMFSTIAKRPWWMRVWIVQECLLPEEPPIIQCGGKTLLWAEFFQAFWNTQRGARRTIPGMWTHPSVMEIYDSAGTSH